MMIMFVQQMRGWILLCVLSLNVTDHAVCKTSFTQTHYQNYDTSNVSRTLVAAIKFSTRFSAAVFTGRGRARNHTLFFRKCSLCHCCCMVCPRTCASVAYLIIFIHVQIYGKYRFKLFSMRVTTKRTVTLLNEHSRKASS
jgi:hypothetical protein